MTSAAGADASRSVEGKPGGERGPQLGQLLRAGRPTQQEEGDRRQVRHEETGRGVVRGEWVMGWHGRGCSDLV